MNRYELRQSAQHEAYQRDVDPCRRALDGSFVIANQSPALHQRSKGSAHNPPIRKHLESLGCIQTLDHFNLQLRSQLRGKVGEVRKGVSPTY